MLNQAIETNEFSFKDRRIAKEKAMREMALERLQLQKEEEDNFRDRKIENLRFGLLLSQVLIGTLVLTILFN